MSVIIPVNFANVRFRWACVGVDNEIGFSVAFAKGLFDTALDLADSVDSVYEGSTMLQVGNIGSQFTYLGVEATLMTASGPVLAAVPQAKTGTATGQRVPINSAVLVAKVTDVGGRRGRGRLYHPVTMLDTAAVEESGFMAGASFTTVSVWFNEIFGQWIVAGAVPFLLHSHPDDAPSQLQALTVRPQLATQRRRMR